MPRRLPERCNPDSIREFRLAAEVRFEDGGCAATAYRRTAAVYLWGYAAEMTLKAGYFSAVGYDARRSITVQNLRFASANAASVGVQWHGNLHDLDSWARLLVSTRSRVPGLQYTAPAFGQSVISHVLPLARLWRETLRYSRNTAYDYEMEQIRTSVQWLLAHSLKL